MFLGHSLRAPARFASDESGNAGGLAPVPRSRDWHRLDPDRRLSLIDRMLRSADAAADDLSLAL